MSEKSNPPRKRRVGNPALTGDAMNLEPGDNARFINLSMEVMALPAIDLNNAEQIEKRVQEYYAITSRYDVKPAVSGLAMALGTNRRTLWGIVNNAAPGGRRGQKPMNLCAAATTAIKKAYDNLEYLWENYMQQGKINPVSGIFLGKNNYGYQDKTEFVVSSGPQADELSAEDIASRYLADSATLPQLEE